MNLDWTLTFIATSHGRVFQEGRRATRVCTLSSQAMAVRARCERTAVERCWVEFGYKADSGSIVPILSISVRWGRAIG